MQNRYFAYFSDFLHIGVDFRIIICFAPPRQYSSIRSYLRIQLQACNMQLSKVVELISPASWTTDNKQISSATFYPLLIAWIDAKKCKEYTYP